MNNRIQYVNRGVSQILKGSKKSLKWEKWVCYPLGNRECFLLSDCGGRVRREEWRDERWDGDENLWERLERRNPVRLPLIGLTFIFQFTPLSEARVPTCVEFPSGFSVVTRSSFLFPCLCITGPSSPSALLRYNWHKTFLCKFKVYGVEIGDAHCKTVTIVS